MICRLALEDGTVFTGTGFGADTDRAAILSATDRDVPLRPWTKAELATAVLDRVAELLRTRGT